MPNATSETHRKWWLSAFFSSCCCYEFWLPFRPAAAEAFAAAGPDGKTPWQWRTEKPLTQLLKPIENDDIGCFFLLLLLWILATFSSGCCRGFCCCCWSPDGKTPLQWRREKPLTQLLKPMENDDFGCFFLLLLLWILVAFSPGCCKGFCCCCWSPDGKTPWQWRREKPQDCIPKMPNATSETHRKWWFWLLFPLAAAMNFGYLFLLLLQRLLLLLLVPGWENTVAVKEGETPKLHPENA